MAIPALLLLAWAVSAVAMALAFVGSRRAGKIGYVDVAWAALMATAALLAAALADGAPLSRALVAVFGAGWAIRLCLHLWRRVSHEAEDGRYLALRERWLDSGLALFAFFQGQALVVALFALPFAVVATRHDAPTPGLVVAATLTWLLSVGGEALADRQLARFRADPGNRGRTCRVGLWAWSRHPNYF
ncbi:MAG: DUF1295 domain-containing protein, partial [Arenimonas sp.]